MALHLELETLESTDLLLLCLSHGGDSCPKAAIEPSIRLTFIAEPVLGKTIIGDVIVSLIIYMDFQVTGN